jgi:hypothetical protein
MSKEEYFAVGCEILTQAIFKMAAMWFQQCVPTFQKNVVLPSSG